MANDERTLRVLTDFTDDRDCVVECFDPTLLAKIMQVIVLTASKVKSQSSAVRANNRAKAQVRANLQGAADKPVPTVHNEVKQEVKRTLDEIEDWEW